MLYNKHCILKCKCQIISLPDLKGFKAFPSWPFPWPSGSTAPYLACLSSLIFYYLLLSSFTMLCWWCQVVPTLGNGGSALTTWSVPGARRVLPPLLLS